jgi:hypothetical protein
MPMLPKIPGLQRKNERKAGPLRFPITNRRKQEQIQPRSHHFVQANPSLNEKPANPIRNPLYKKLEGTNEKEKKSRLITNFWVASREAGRPICFYDSSRDRIGKSRTRSLCAKKERKSASKVSHPSNT